MVIGRQYNVEDKYLSLYIVLGYIKAWKFKVSAGSCDNINKENSFFHIGSKQSNSLIEQLTYTDVLHILLKYGPGFYDINWLLTGILAISHPRGELISTQILEP